MGLGKMAHFHFLFSTKFTFIIYIYICVCVCIYRNEEHLRKATSTVHSIFETGPNGWETLSSSNKSTLSIGMNIISLCLQSATII
jgi:hypothetical protein